MEILAFVLLLIYLLIGAYAPKLRSNYCQRSPTMLKVHSFSTGVLLAALFLIFFQEVYHVANPTPLLCVMAISFTLFYGLHLYQQQCHESKRIKQLVFRLKALKFTLRSVHHLLIGMLFAHWSHQSTLGLFVTAIPLLFLKTIGTFELAKQEKHSIWYKLVVEGMAVLGFLLPFVTNIIDPLFYTALAFVAGGIFYIIISRIFVRLEISISFMILGELVFGALIVAGQFV